MKSSNILAILIFEYKNIYYRSQLNDIEFVLNEKELKIAHVTATV